MSRSVKKHEYTGSKRFDKSCRCHGGCPYCENNRLLYRKIGEDLLKLGLEESKTFLDNHRGRLRVVRLNIDDIVPLETIVKGCPPQVKIDLTKAFEKIKLKLSCGIGGTGSTHEA